MVQIGTLHIASTKVSNGKYFVICYDDKAKFNPYRVYEKYWKGGWHKKLLEKYGDLLSCQLYITDYVRQNNEEGR